MGAASPLRWTERTLFLTLLLSGLFKLFHPLLGIPLTLSSGLFKLSVALLFFFYIAWPWLFSPPIDIASWWDRTLHFTAPFLWAYNFLGILLALTEEAFMERSTVKGFYGVTEGILTLFVIALSIKGIHYSSKKAAIRYHGWIIGRVFLIGILTYWTV